MKRIGLSIVGFAFVIAWAELGPGVSGRWWPAPIPALAQMMLVAAIAAPLLVLYFDWPARLMRRLLADDDSNENLNGNLRQDVSKGLRDDVNDGLTRSLNDELNKAA